MAHDGQVLGLVEGVEGQPQSEAFGEGDLFLHGLPRMNLAFQHPRVAVVGQGFGHQVAAVGGGIDQDIFGRRADRAFQDSLQMLIARLVTGKRQVIAEQNAAFRSAMELAKQVGKLVQLRLADLDQPQTSRRIGRQHGLHQRRLACPSRAPQQGIVGGLTGQKLAGVALQDVFLPVEPEQIIQGHDRWSGHRLEGAPSIPPAAPTPGRGLRQIDRCGGGGGQPGFQPVRQPMQPIQQALKIIFRHGSAPPEASRGPAADPRWAPYQHPAAGYC